MNNQQHLLDGQESALSTYELAPGDSSITKSLLPMLSGLISRIYEEEKSLKPEYERNARAVAERRILEEELVEFARAQGITGKRFLSLYKEASEWIQSFKEQQHQNFETRATRELSQFKEMPSRYIPYLGRTVEIPYFSVSNIQELEYASSFFKGLKGDATLFYVTSKGEGFLLGEEPFPSTYAIKNGKFDFGKELEEEKLAMLEAIERYGDRKLRQKFMKSLSLATYELEKKLPETRSEMFQDLLYELNRKVGIDEEHSLPVYEASENENIRFQPVNSRSHPFKRYRIKIRPQLSPSETLDDKDVWDKPKLLDRDGYAVVGEIDPFEMELYDRELGFRAFNQLSRISKSEFWGRIRDEIANSEIKETEPYQPIKIIKNRTEGKFLTKVRKHWGKMLKGAIMDIILPIAAGAAVATYGLNIAKSVKPVYAHNGDVLPVGYPANLVNDQANIPNIDGIYNMTLKKALMNGNTVYVDEWNDSTKIPLIHSSIIFPNSNYQGSSYLMLKRTPEKLFFLFDYVSDLTATGTKGALDNAWLVFDRDHKNSSCLNNNFKGWAFATEPPFAVNTYTGADCHTFGISPGSSGLFFKTTLGKSPNSNIPHKIVEGSIDMRYVISPQNMQNIVGFYAGIRDGSNAAFIIPDTNGVYPNQYADLRFVNYAIPEFPNAGLISATMAAASNVIYLLKKRGNKKNLKDNQKR